MKMRVEAASNYLYTSQLRATDRAREITATAAQAASAPQAVEETPREKIAKPVDFSRMTWQELHEWKRKQYSRGEISTDEIVNLSIMSFLGCGLRINEATDWIEFPEDGKVFDFMQMARDGVALAREHLVCGNQEIGQQYLDLFGTALSVMERFQERNMSVDVFA